MVFVYNELKEPGMGEAPSTDSTGKAEVLQVAHGLRVGEARHRAVVEIAG
jgi:hypothetical protein